MPIPPNGVGGVGVSSWLTSIMSAQFCEHEVRLNEGCPHCILRLVRNALEQMWPELQRGDFDDHYGYMQGSVTIKFIYDLVTLNAR